MAAYKSGYYSANAWQGLSAEIRAKAAANFAAYVKNFGRAVEGDRGCLCALKTGRHPGGAYYCQRSWFGHIDILDHATRFILDGRTTAIVGQLYGPLDPETMGEIVRWCVRQRLCVRTDYLTSFHYPGWTVALIFTRSAI